MRRRLIVYAKRPRAEYAKTRLGAAIGPEQAAGVYARLLYAYLLDLLSADMAGIEIELAVTSVDDVTFFVQAFPELIVRPQVEGNLGHRMARSFRRAFAEGIDRAVLTGSDIPSLDYRIVLEAFDALNQAPAVIGPASDGGYYLIGMRAPGYPLFDGIAWSSERVLAQTEALAQSQGLAMRHLRELFDVDTGEDFENWRGRRNKGEGVIK